MRVAYAKQDVEVSGQAAETVGSIHVNPMVIRLLTDNLYSDRFAFTREYPQNAMDAAGSIHRIKFPSVLDPTFEVEDRGPGMSRDFMLGIGDYADPSAPAYPRIFSSPKNGDVSWCKDEALKKRLLDESAEARGGFGHGRLSGLAYFANSDNDMDGGSYLVETRTTDEYGVYAVYRNSVGIPTVRELHSGPNTEDYTGTVVKVPIKSADFSEVRNKAQHYLARMRPTPPGIEPIKYKFQGDGWGIRDNDRYNSTSYAVMGGLAYEINTYKAFNGQVPDVYHAAVDVDFPIGSLKLPITRDSLIYDAATVQALRDRAKVVSDEMSKLFDQDFKSCTTDWERRVVFSKIKASIPWQIFNSIKGNLPVTKTDVYLGLNANQVVYVYEPRNRRRGTAAASLSFTTSTNLAIDVNDQWVVAVWDGSNPLHYQKRLIHNYGTSTPIILIKTPNLLERQKMLDALGNPPFEDIKDLEEPPKAPPKPRNTVTPGPRQVVKVKVYNKSSVDFDDFEATLEPNKVYPYMERHGFQIMDTPLWHKFRDSPLLPANMLVIPKTCQGILKKNPKQFIHINDYMKEALTKWVKEVDAAQLFYDADQYSTYTSRESYEDTHTNNALKALAEGYDPATMGKLPKNLLAFIQNLGRCCKAAHTPYLAVTKELVQSFKISIGSPKLPPYDLKANKPNIQQDYPLLYWVCRKDRYLAKGEAANLVKIINA